MVIGNTSFAALCPEASEKFCASFSTVGLSCPGGCGKKHTWYDRFGHDLKSAQESYVEQHKDKVRFNKESY